MLPPGPSTPPLYQIARWIFRPLDLLDSCHRRYGDVFTLRAPGNVPFVIIAVPELVKEVFAADPDVLLAGRGNATLLEPILGVYSLLTLDGAAHMRQRRLLLPALHGERLQAFATQITAIATAALDRAPTNEPFAIHKMMQSITLDVILQTVFGTDDARGELRRRLLELLDITTNPWLLVPGMLGIDPLKLRWLRIARRKREVDACIYRMIAERRSHGVAVRNDMLSMMLEARDEAGASMTDVEIRDELVTLLLAGHETTATSLAWAIDRLLAHPQVLAKLRAEVAAGRDEYLDAVIRETLRVRPIVPLIGRHVARPYQLGRWTIPVGARIAPSIYLCARRADMYPDPDRFLPERWLGAKPDPFSWFPFGGGIRRCIGMAFALFEMRVVLSTLVTRADLRRDGDPAKIVRRGITLAPSDGTRVFLRSPN